MVESIWLRGFGGTAGAAPSTRQLYKALTKLRYDFNYEEEREDALRYLARFTQRWGVISADNLLAVARRFAPVDLVLQANAGVRGDVAILEPETSEEADTLFALATLGELHTSKTPPALLPYLKSPRAQERWLAALGLAAMRDERSLPALGQMLVEFMGPNQPQRSDGSLVYCFQRWRADLPQMLTNWGEPRVVPLLRAALIATLQAREGTLQEPYGPEQEFIWAGGALHGARGLETVLS
jgi:PBS lyase HEAT-like repeat-containing protein